jgi:putative membrane protein
MGAPKEMTQRANLSDYLAAERTFLAWIRTGLAMMGFGFVVARFGLFLEEFSFAQHITPAKSYGFSLWFGTALIAAGIIVNVFAGWHHARLVRALDHSETALPRPSSYAVAIAFFLALVGLAMAIYLLSIRSPTNSQSAKSEVIFMMHPCQDSGIIDIPNDHTMDETVEKLKEYGENPVSYLVRYAADSWRLGGIHMSRTYGVMRRHFFRLCGFACVEGDGVGAWVVRNFIRQNLTVPKSSNAQGNKLECKDLTRQKTYQTSTSILAAAGRVFFTDTRLPFLPVFCLFRDKVMHSLFLNFSFPFS